MHSTNHQLQVQFMNSPNVIYLPCRKYSSQRLYTKYSSQRMYTKYSSQRLYTKYSSQRLFTKYSSQRLYTKCSSQRLYAKYSSQRLYTKYSSQRLYTKVHWCISLFCCKALEWTFGLDINAQITQVHRKWTRRYFLEMLRVHYLWEFFFPTLLFQGCLHLVYKSDSVKCHICKLAARQETCDVTVRRDPSSASCFLLTWPYYWSHFVQCFYCYSGRLLYFFEELTYLLTYSMEQSPSWEANWFCS